jgi:hypothetical protein
VRRVTAGILAWLVSAATVGCTPTPTTTHYETYAWSVDIPNKLEVSPSPRVPQTVWEEGPEWWKRGDGSGVRIVARQVSSQDGDDETAIRTVGEVLAGPEMSLAAGPTMVDLPSGRAAFAAGTIFQDPFVAVAIRRDGWSVLFYGLGIDRADLEAVVNSFTLKNPPDDPSNPPPS